MLKILLASLGVAIITFTLSVLLGALMMRTGVVDAPDESRKTQAQPVPRLGGVAIALALILGCVIAILTFLIADGAALDKAVLSVFGFAEIVLTDMPAFLAMTLAAFLIGLWDDIATADTKLKLFIMVAVCIATAIAGLHPETLTSPFGNISLTPVLIIGSALWLLVFTNAANFIDGANGLSIGSLAIMLGGLALASSQHSDLNFSLWWFALFGAIAGFLVHNLRGKLYAGDAGALGLGALFASLSLVSGLDVWTVATLALPFLLDVLLTLIWRAKHGRAWLAAHTDHAYQRLIASGWSHGETAFLYWGLSTACAIAAIIAIEAGGAAPFAVFWALLVCGCSLWLSVARRKQTGEDF